MMKIISTRSVLSRCFGTDGIEVMAIIVGSLILALERVSCLWLVDRD
jgi:hypothetical protein